MLAVLCQDENMIRDASEGKDLYSAIAAKAFHTTYNECLEHFPKDTPIKKDGKDWRYATEEEIKLNDYDKLANGETDTYSKGKERRKQAKVILLGLMYGRGRKALAEQLNCSEEEAQDIMNSVYAAFPKIREYENRAKAFAKKTGYITTLWGRKRRLQDIKKQPYEFDFSNSRFNETNYSNYRDLQRNYVNKYSNKLNEVYWKEKEKNELLSMMKNEDGVIVTINTGLIARAERQIVNASVQGSAADMSKKAIVRINEDEELRDLGFQMLVPVHDEILGQCPLANAKKCKELFTYDMEHCAEDRVPLEIKVDPTCSFAWYGDDIDVNTI